MSVFFAIRLLFAEISAILLIKLLCYLLGLFFLLFIIIYPIFYIETTRKIMKSAFPSLFPVSFISYNYLFPAYHLVTPGNIFLPICIINIHTTAVTKGTIK